MRSPGNEDTFDVFFRREHPRLLALGIGWTGNRELAGDYAQEALSSVGERRAEATTLDGGLTWTVVDSPIK